jgi:hypothetical protein
MPKKRKNTKTKPCTPSYSIVKKLNCKRKKAFTFKALTKNESAEE